MTGLRMIGLGAAAALAVGLGACVSTPLYAPAMTENSSGYSEERLDANQYRVTFTGRRSTSRQRVEDGLLLRAAEVTQAAGYTHFLIANRQTAQDVDAFSGFDRWGPSFGFGIGYGRGYPYSRWGLYDPFWYRSSLYWDDFRRERYVAYADIAVIGDAEARGNPLAIEARDVIANLRPNFVPPR